ncbi:DegT/DnrJ/EryC1/StrS family aminotransferase [Pseudoalteromonas sp. MMG005]|uniref:DegT/DnrJ/EryC1/StrS family aminotransferase n=1 Tax=Pseudoalteromonas sp. MMG005 TaxID=2822682 RepID=UPI001B3A62C5|nr:DegT/DnrJ/EryC1/StrS family aminotransferase [Pseudoalteromonas sp. MMG005]MBQ4846325.1 DegT/DnrJ/EryC1/StrS family aminotransferase [Pseudoalteromonas sp. MMG005]
MHVPFLKLSISENEQENILLAIKSVLNHGQFIQGPEHNLLEKKVAELCNRKYCIAVGSGTDALFLTFKVLGIGRGQEVITTPLSWIASTNAFVMHGATPVFADIDNTLNIDPEHVDRLINEKTAAILAVDYAGHPANYERLVEISKKYKIPLIEDGSQAFGAKYNNQTVGSFGLVSCISMNPMKPLSALGEAGVILTDDSLLYEQFIAARYSGMVNKELCYKPSINCRMDTIQAAILLEKLKNYEKVTHRRQTIAQKYIQKLSPYVSFPSISADTSHAYYLFLLYTEHRESLFNFLNENQIEARIRDSILIPSQPCYEHYDSVELKKARQAADLLLAIPAHEKMTDEQVEFVILKVIEFYETKL